MAGAFAEFLPRNSDLEIPIATIKLLTEFSLKIPGDVMSTLKIRINPSVGQRIK